MHRAGPIRMEIIIYLLLLLLLASPTTTITTTEHFIFTCLSYYCGARNTFCIHTFQRVWLVVVTLLLPPLTSMIHGWLLWQWWNSRYIASSRWGGIIRVLFFPLAMMIWKEAVLWQIMMTQTIVEATMGRYSLSLDLAPWSLSSLPNMIDKRTGHTDIVTNGWW